MFAAFCSVNDAELEKIWNSAEKPVAELSVMRLKNFWDLLLIP